MPKAMERSLKKQARKKFGSTTSERARKYIYGTMRKHGWKPSGHNPGYHGPPVVIGKRGSDGFFRGA